MVKSAEDPAMDPVIRVIEDDRPRLSLGEWLERLRGDEPVDLGISAAELLAEARAEEGL
jgi:hypothetical protein